MKMRYYIHFETGDSRQCYGCLAETEENAKEKFFRSFPNTTDKSIDYIKSFKIKTKKKNEK